MLFSGKTFSKCSEVVVRLALTEISQSGAGNPKFYHSFLTNLNLITDIFFINKSYSFPEVLLQSKFAEDCHLKIHIIKGGGIWRVTKQI